MRVDESITIEASRERVWAQISDPSKSEVFMKDVHFTPIKGEPTTGPRARYTMRMKVGSTELGGTIEVTEFDPPHEMAWNSITGIDQRGRWILREQGHSRTKVTLRFGYQAPGGLLALVADRVARPLVRGNLRDSLGALKRMLEVR